MTPRKDWINELKKAEDFVYIAEPEEVRDLVDDLEDAECLALDTETYVEYQWKGVGGSAVDPHTARISILAIKSRDSLPIILDLIELERAGWSSGDRQPLVEFLKSRKRLYAFNAKFDLNMMRKEFGVILDNFFCLRVLVKMVTNALGSKFARKCGASLQDVLRDYLDIHLGGKGAEQVSDWYPRPEDTSMLAPFLSKVRYAAGDIKYLFDIRDLLEPVVVGPLPNTGLLEGSGDPNMPLDEAGLDMQEALELEQQSQVPIAEMEWNGLPIALEAADDFYGSLRDPYSPRGELNRLGGILCQRLGIEWNLEEVVGVEYPVPKDHKPLRNPQKLRDLVKKKLGLLNLDNVQKGVLNRLLDLFVELEQVKSNEKEDIEWANEEEAEKYSEIKEIDQGMISEHTELIKLILEYKHLDKVMGMDLRDKINPVTKRVHATYDSMGASTSRSSSSCIAKGQRVMVPGGFKPIEQIEVGDYVYCYDDNNKPTLSRVNNKFYKGVRDVVRVKWQGKMKYGRTGRLVCTPDHLIKTRDRGWIQAKDLKRYDVVYHLCRESTKKPRPRIYGTGYFEQQEQIFIKNHYFGTYSNKYDIHHIDHDPTNNSLDNLQILEASKHKAYHASLIRPKNVRPKCSLNRKLLHNNQNWKEVSKFTLLRMIAETRGRPSKVSMDFETYKRKCRLKGIDLKSCCERYSRKGVYLSKANIKKALRESRNTEIAAKKLGVGTRKLKRLCEEFGITYSNHLVTSVTDCGQSEVYDLEVDKYHNFITEEIVTHNCPNAQQINGRVKVIVERLLDEPLDQPPDYLGV